MFYCVKSHKKFKILDTFNEFLCYCGFGLRPSIVYCKQRIFFFITVKTNIHFPHHLFQTHLFPLHRRSGIQFLLPEHHTCHIKEVQLKANFCIIDASRQYLLVWVEKEIILTLCLGGNRMAWEHAACG